MLSPLQKKTRHDMIKKGGGDGLIEKEMIVYEHFPS